MCGNVKSIVCCSAKADLGESANGGKGPIALFVQQSFFGLFHCTVPVASFLGNR